MTEKHFNALLEKYEKKNEKYEMRQALNKEKYKYKKKWHLPTTSKLISLYLFVVLTVILVYSMVAMWYFADLSYLGVLITDIAGYLFNYYIYAKKAALENSKGGIVYETAMAQMKESQEQAEGLEQFTVESSFDPEEESEGGSYDSEI